MKNQVTVSAPGKLMLLGEHAVVYNHPCLVTAVGQRMKVKVEFLDDPVFELNAPDVNVKNYKKLITGLGKGDIPKGAKFVEIAVKNFSQKYPLKFGVKIETISEFSSKFGFGSSSASTVCTIKALSELLDIKLSAKEIFDLAYKTVLDIQGKGSGFDVAAAVYGGTLYFVTAGKVIEPLQVVSIPLLVGYSGIKADTVAMINKVLELAKNNSDFVEDIYNKIEKLVEEAKTAIVNSNWPQLGTLMNQNQNYLEKLGVSIEKLDSMIGAAKNAGAYGAKLSGAGGGDCMIALVPDGKREAIKKAIESVGGEILDVKTNVEGVRIEN